MPPFGQLTRGKKFPAGNSYATVLPDMDYETYSEAGYQWIPHLNKWSPELGAQKGGLFAVGAVKYAQHPTTEVLSFYYDLKDGQGPRHWTPEMPPPLELFEYLSNGGIIEGHHVFFEYCIWNFVCVLKYGWPPLKYTSLRDSMAKARAFALPGKLEKAGEVLQIPTPKQKEGKRLLEKFSRPQKPTKKDPRKRILLKEEPEDALKLFDYNKHDILSESEVSLSCPDLSPFELEYWLNCLACNIRGLAVDVQAVVSCVYILEQAYSKYNSRLRTLTSGEVSEASKVAQLQKWCESQGVILQSMEDENLDKCLRDPAVPLQVKEALEIRKKIGSAGVKKVYAMLRQVTKYGRVHDLLVYHLARTGRDGGTNIQPQNLVKAGPKLNWCSDMTCKKPYGQELNTCPHCGASETFSEKTSWKWQATEDTIAVLNTRSLEQVEKVYPNAVQAISGCIRGLFIAGPGKEFICSDYSAIEAVVIAMLAGESWRIETFQKQEDIYLRSAAGITGISFEEYIEYAKKNKDNHPDRQKIGKVAELGLGFGGWVNAWRQFDKTDNFSEYEIKKLILAWRGKSPLIVELWGGQSRGKPWEENETEYFGLEGAAISAVLNPGECFTYRYITYGVKDDILYCRLPSGRCLTYHQPRVTPSSKWPGQLQLSFMGWNTNPKMGAIGWIRIFTFGGRLTENVTQAVARDIMAKGVNNLERANYPHVLRLHDEVLSEVPVGYGTIEEFEYHLGNLPDWAKDWPVYAKGGWRGKRFRKD